MSERAISFGRAFAIQLRLAVDHGWRGRLIGFSVVFAELVAIVVFGVILGLEISSEGISVLQEVDFSTSFRVPLDRGSVALVVCLGALAVIGWFGPFKLWEGEAPSRREYHWAMPVSKGAHDLARVAAGLVLLAAWEAVLYGGVLVLALAAGSGGLFAGVTPLVWASLCLGPVLGYLLTSVFAVRLEHPSAWLWSTVGAVAVVSTFSALVPGNPVSRVLDAVLFGPWGLVTAFGGPVGVGIFRLDPAAAPAWPAVWLGWAALLTAAVAWAARDRRRLP